MRKSLRREQVELLRFEKQLLGLGAGLAALTGSAGAKAAVEVGGMVDGHAEAIAAAYLELVRSVQAAHDQIEAVAAAAGVGLLDARGTPKDPPLLEAARSLLGIG